MQDNILTRRQALASILALPALCSGNPSENLREGRAPCPSWATSWDDAACDLASLEESAARQDYPRTFSRLEYESAMQWSSEVLLIYGVGGFHNYRRQLRAGSSWDVLGSGISRRGGAWAVFVVATLSDAGRRELREQDARREQQQRRAES